MSKAIRTFFQSGIWAYALFWAWNAIFLAFMLLGFAPLLLPSLVLGTQEGIIPAPFLANALLLILIPIAACGLGLTVLRREPHKLFALGYAVEGPLMLMVAIRFFVVRELTAVLAFILITAALGMLTFVWQLLDKKIDTRGALATHARVLGLTLFALVAVYVGIWLAFYAIPLASVLVRGLYELLMNFGDFLRAVASAISDFPRNLAFIPFAVFGMLAFAFSATLFVLMPIAVPFLVLRAWWSAVQNYMARFGAVRAALVTSATAALCAFLFVFLNQQPQLDAFAQLENPPQTTAAAQKLAANEETLRAGLLNAYLASQRYTSSVGEVRHIRDLYHSTVGLPNQYASEIEKAYQLIASPLLYVPVGEPVENAGAENNAIVRESEQASQLYEEYFDESIFDGERETVLTALGSTWDVTRAAQAIQDADDRAVHLNRQDLNVVEHGDWAEFELHEEYQNVSGERQEVVYFVTLPESAVVTGVWLGNSDNREERFEYRVAPRGAAQQVYREQVRLNVDPALVEQIGTRQYRIRVFPVEPKTLDLDQQDFGFYRTSVRAGAPLHFWLTWRVMANDNRWMLPYLAEKRNVYWDAKTVRTVNGQVAGLSDASTDYGSGDGWLPSSLPASSTTTASTHRFDLPDGKSIVAQPLAADALPKLPSAAKLAVVIDRSRSMAPLSHEVNSALVRLEEIAAQGAQVDVYLTASKYRGEAPSRVALDAVNADVLTYLGGQNPVDLLEQFGQLRGTTEYDAVLVLTDGTGYALGKNDAPPAPVNAPLWFVHLGGNFPLGYDDATLQEIQSGGGGVTAGMQEALDRLAVGLALKRGETLAGVTAAESVDWVDGYAWLTLPTTEAQARFAEIASEEGFAPFAARRLILTNAQRERASLEQLDALDALHALAKQYSVVSPYSSMIVLVNETQERRLEEAEEQGDRFDRELEEVGQTQQPFDVTAVPEPHEYVLMALAAAALVWYARKRKRAAQRI